MTQMVPCPLWQRYKAPCERARVREVLAGPNLLLVEEWGLVPQGKLQQDRGSLLEFGFDHKVATELLCPSAHVC